MSTSEPQMPADWDDHTGWDRYYSCIFQTGDDQDLATNPGSFAYDRLPGLVNELRERGCSDIWFAGCGLSPLPRLFSDFGFVVHATDVSPTAINFQRHNHALVSELWKRVGTIQNTAHGTLQCAIHDFRT